MRKIIEKYSIKPQGLFKTLFITFLFGYLPFALLHITLNILGIIPVNFNETEIYGLKGVLVIILFTPFIVLCISFFTWLYFVIGVFVLKALKKMFYE